MNDADRKEETPLLEVDRATKIYGGGMLEGGKEVVALRDCTLTLNQAPATITAVAGESGSGKSTLAGAILGFVKLSEGRVRFQGRDIAAMDRRERFEYRRNVQAVFQDPYAVFNPFYRVRHVFDLVVRRFGIAANRREARDKVEEALNKVGLQGGELLDKYPHQLSGGQRQRMMVARAYLMAPRLIVADEPVSMVDASLRSTILDIMMRLRDESGISFLYITHDLSTAYQICDDIHVFYRGALVEGGPVDDVLGNAKHPYTQLLLDSIPLPDPAQRWAEGIPARDIEAEQSESDAGCAFCARCPKRMDQCRHAVPQLLPLPGAPHTPPAVQDKRPASHKAACFLWQT